jgi:hypothetical protein
MSIRKGPNSIGPGNTRAGIGTVCSVSLAVRHTPDRAVAGLAGHSDHIMIAGPPRAADLPCTGLLSAASLWPTRCVTYPHANFLTPMENARERQSQRCERGTT